VGSYVISSFDLAYNLSKIIDLVNTELSSHHHRVAYISAAIAAECGLDNDKMINVIIASLIHDIALSYKQNLENFPNLTLKIQKR